MHNATDFIIGEVIIYVFSALFIAFDAYIITKIVLLWRKKEKVNIDWKFSSLNLTLFVLTYGLLIISYLMLFVPHLFDIALLTNRQRDAFKAVTIVLFVTFFLRYLIFTLTFKYSFFISDQDKITLLNQSLWFNQIKKIDQKNGLLIVKYQKETKLETKIFLKSTKLSKTLLQISK